MKAALILTYINPSAGPKEELKFLVKSQGNGMLVRVLSPVSMNTITRFFKSIE